MTRAAPPHHNNIAHTAEYNVEFTTDDGRHSTHVIEAGHLRARFDAVLKTSAVTVKIFGLRDDLGVGKEATAHLAGEVKVPEMGKA